MVNFRERRRPLATTAIGREEPRDLPAASRHSVSSPTIALFARLVQNRAAHPTGSARSSRQCPCVIATTREKSRRARSPSCTSKYRRPVSVPHMT